MGFSSKPAKIKRPAETGEREQKASACTECRGGVGETSKTSERKRGKAVYTHGFIRLLPLASLSQNGLSLCD